MTLNTLLQAIRNTCCFLPQRYLMTFMSFLGVVITYALRVCLSMAITKMVSIPHNNQTNSNNESSHEHYSALNGEGKIQWDEETQGWILSSFYIGYVAAHLPGAYLTKIIGGKFTLGLGILCSSLCSLLSPSAACYSAGALVATRITMGLFEGLTFPALSELLSTWAPPNERSLLSSIVFAGVQIGTVVSMATTGYMIDKIPWPAVFYIFGSTGTIWFIFWLLLVYDTPSSNPFISKSELDYLKERIPKDENKLATPWRRMLKSGPLWALIIVQMGHDYALYTCTTDLPKFYQDVTSLSYTHNGIVSALPYLVMWLTSVLMGYISDKIIEVELTTTTTLRRILATIGAVAPGIGMVASSYITKGNWLITVLTISLAFLAFHYSSIRVNPLDLSPNHAAAVMALVNGLGALSGCIGPSVVGKLITDTQDIYGETRREEKVKQWQTVFWVVFAVLVLSNLPYLLSGSGDVQPWDKPEQEPVPSELRRRSTLSGGEPIREKYRNYYHPEQPTIIE